MPPLIKPETSSWRPAVVAALATVISSCASHTTVPATGTAPVEIDADAGAAKAVQQAHVTGPQIVVPSATVATADLDRRTAELFGESAYPGTMRVPLDSALLTSDAEPTWDIDVRSYETVERVRRYVSLFTTTGEARSRFVDRLSRGTRYEPMIRAKLRAGDLPEDMYYLALVESGFNPHAYSRAAAVGMWQFMASTARGMGLQVDWWIDERRDPVRSTEAAVSFLRGLREQFGSMYLAAAAYNGGPGRIARGLTRYAEQLEGSSGDDMFFALAKKKYLRNETREYVPQLVAAALVAKDSARFRLSIKAQPRFAYDSVRVGPRIPLTAIATASGATVAQIEELNPHILRGMTPPRDSTKVRILPATRARFDSAYDALPPEEKIGAKTVVTQKGATWTSLARKTSVSARAIALYNPKVKASKKTGKIATGTSVLIPTSAVVAAALAVPDPSIEHYGRGTRTHVVRAGENLSVIAKHYGTTPTAIMRLNRLRKPLIFPGQELLVRGNGGADLKARRSTRRNRL